MSEIINSKIFKIMYDGYDKFYVCGTLKDRNFYMNGFYKKYTAHIKGQTSNKMVMFPIFDKILLDSKDKTIIDIIKKIDIKDDYNKNINEENEESDNDDVVNEEDEQSEEKKVAGKDSKKTAYKLTTDEIKIVLKVLRTNIKLVDIKISIALNSDKELKMVHQKCIDELRKTGKCLNINDVFNPKKTNSYDNSKVVKIYSETDKKIIFIGSTTQKINIYFNTYLRKFNDFENGKSEIDSDVYKVFRAGNAKYEILFEGKLPDRNALLLKTQEYIDKNKCVNSSNAVQDKDYQHNYSIANSERKKEYREKNKQEKQ